MSLSIVRRGSHSPSAAASGASVGVSLPPDAPLPSRQALSFAPSSRRGCTGYPPAPASLGGLHLSTTDRSEL